MTKTIQFLISILLLTVLFLASCNKDENIDLCEDTLCLNNGVCVDGRCNCPEGFSGANCETQTDPCLNITCLNGGTCVNGSCDCPPGYSGVDCGTQTDPCLNITCLNGGTCVNGSCNCPTGYTGSDCGTQMTPSRMRVTNIKLIEFPPTDNGAGWDLSSGADIYVTMHYNNTEIYNHPTFFENANFNSTYNFQPNINLNLNNPTDNYIIRLFDFDSIGDDDYMGGIQFTPYFSSTNGFPSIIRLDANAGLIFELSVDYTF